MNRLIVIGLSAFAALGLASLPGNGSAQQADVEGVKATSNAFYSAIAALDNGVSMEKIWAQTPYVTLAGPRSKSFTVGWDAVKKYWDNADKLFLERKASLSEFIFASMATSPGRLGRRSVKQNEGRRHTTDQFPCNPGL